METKVRRAGINDLEEVMQLNLMLFKKEQGEYDKTLNCEWTFSSEGKAYFTKRIVQDDGCLFVAYEDEKIVGYLAGGIKGKKSGRVSLKIAELENMFILEEYRSKGVGTLLYQKFEKWCKEKDVQRLRVAAYMQNAEGINFYKKNGFFDYDLILERDI